MADFDAIFAQERTPMVRLAFLMLGSESLAEEVVHDGFVALLERWGRIDNPGAYLRRCVVNGCLDLKRRARHVALRPEVEEATELGVDHMVDVLQALPPQRRAMVVLRYYADMSQEAIAESLRLPVGTIKSGLHRALGALKEALSDARG
ncbi:MAG TPA: sigma-70 family RNA polymerase sigma factor [Acidimicrobiales bacterium]